MLNGTNFSYITVSSLQIIAAREKNSWGINPHGGNSVLYRSGFDFYVGNEKVLLLTFSGVGLQFT